MTNGQIEPSFYSVRKGKHLTVFFLFQFLIFSDMPLHQTVNTSDCRVTFVSSYQHSLAQDHFQQAFSLGVYGVVSLFVCFLGGVSIHKFPLTSSSRRTTGVGKD